MLQDLHHGGVFEVFPSRIIHAEALRADFVLVSHRHPDHFDPMSLKRLAELDPDTVLVTPDALVAEVGRRLGFRTTRIVDPETQIDLDGPRILTTPSPHATDPEWGVLVATEDGTVWNQVDTSLGSVADVARFFTRAAAALDRPRAKLVTLALARWQPLLEVECSLADHIGFPFRAYASELEHIAAIDARAVCPSGAGARHAPPFAAMNQLVYPVPEARFLADARARMPEVRVLPSTIGATYHVHENDVSVIERGAVTAGLVSVDETQPLDPRDFRPLAIPDLVDPSFDSRDEATLRSRVDHWAREDLARALEGQSHARRVLEVVFATETIAYTFDGASIRVGVDPSWDLRCAIAGSLLVDVLDGRRHWGDLLLGGMLRGASRAYTVDAKGLHRRAEQPLFVYHAISYEESVRRAIESVLHDI